MPRKRTFSEYDYLGLGKQIRTQILVHYRQDSCIATTAATVEVLRILGIPAFGLKVETFIVNDILYRAAVANGDEFPAWGSPEYPEGGYGIGVGLTDGPPQPGEWPGHLVCIAERRWLLDFSIDQASRPEHGISLGPQVIPITEKFLRTDGARVTYQSGSAYLYYISRPKEKDWKDLPNWLEPPKVDVKVQKTSPAKRRAIQ